MKCLQTAKRSFTFASWNNKKGKEVKCVSKPLSGRSLLQGKRQVSAHDALTVSKPLSGRSLLQA